MRLTCRVAPLMLIVGTVVGAASVAAQPAPPGNMHLTGDHRPQHPPAADHHAHRFEDADALAKRFDDPARDAWQMPTRVIEALRLRSGQTVADIGAGTGYFTARLAASATAPRVYAVDVEPAMVAYLTERARREHLANVTPVLGTAEATNLPVAVDLALVVDTYHHIPNRVAYFRSLATQLTPDGRLAIVDFRKDSPEGPPVQYRFTPEQIDAELSQAGFVREAAHDFLPRQHFLVYRRR